MIVTMHGLTTMHCNLVTDYRVAKETGYDALELLVAKLLRYLDTGYTVKDLKSSSLGIPTVCFNALANIERIAPREHKELLAECERLCAAAEALGCPTIQLVSLCGLEGRPWPEVRDLTAKNIAELADIAAKHNVRYQLEPIAWSPIHTLAQSLEVIDAAGRDNVGMVIDFWHLEAGEGTTPDEVAKLDKSLIYGVHFCDGVRHSKGTKWVEEDLRGFLPGEGKIPIKEWVDAVRATGFDGVWSSELFSPKHWEWDIWEIARESKARMERYLR